MNQENNLPSSEPTDSAVPPSEPQGPLITIATVTYNAAQTLERTLQSVARQDYPRIEHLIVDGCSTDSTLSVVQSYVAENTRTSHPHHIRLICEHDSGLYDAMNKAITNASGEYLVFLNAGDCLHADSTISQAVAKAQWRKGDARNPAVLYGETDLVDEAGQFLRHRRLSAPRQLASRSFLSGMLVLTDYLSEGMTTRHHKASLLERLRIMARHYGWLRALAAHAWFVIRAVLRK